LGNRNQKSKRPFSVTLFALAVLSIAVIHLVRFIQAIQQWEFLASWPGVSPLYLAVTGIVWLGAGLPLAWGLWWGKGWAPVASRIILLAFILYGWLDRILIANREVTMSRDASWPFWAGFTLFIAILTYCLFSRPRTKAFFRSDS
jgi:fucose 4-O-acetylase-like acetyltransferase